MISFKNWYNTAGPIKASSNAEDPGFASRIRSKISSGGYQVPEKSPLKKKTREII